MRWGSWRRGESKEGHVAVSRRLCMPAACAPRVRCGGKGVVCGIFKYGGGHSRGDEQKKQSTVSWNQKRAHTAFMYPIARSEIDRPESKNKPKQTNANDGLMVCVCRSCPFFVFLSHALPSYLKQSGEAFTLATSALPHARETKSQERTGPDSMYKRVAHGAAPRA